MWVQTGDIVVGTEPKPCTDSMFEHSERLGFCNRSSVLLKAVTEYVGAGVWGGEGSRGACQPATPIPYP